MKRIVRSPAPRLVPLAGAGRYPLYRIRISPNFKDCLIGCTLGSKYWVLSSIGKGGMSVVYKAKTKGTGKTVAVKTLRTQGLTDEMLVKRFQREAELLSRLNHPRIVNLHAYGTSSRGQPYFVMDYLVGQNLTELLKKIDHLPPERFQDIFVQVCAAIEHAHKHNAIHRYIKPGNIMLTRQGQTRDYVKIVDFGIAMISEEAQRLTRMGEVWGSPIYMSPEQCMGATVDLRSDIYSLGVVMYESLTGRVPFLGKNYGDTMGKQISEPPPPMKEVRPDLEIPASLEKIVMKALAKLPDERYQTLTTMRKELESALSFKQDSGGPGRTTGTKHKTTSQERLPDRKNEKQKLELKRQEYRPQESEIDFDLEEEKPVRRPGAKTRSKTRTTTTSAKPALKSVRQVKSSRKKAAATKGVRLKPMILVVCTSIFLSGAIIFAINNMQSLTKILGEAARFLLKGATEESHY